MIRPFPFSSRYLLRISVRIAALGMVTLWEVAACAPQAQDTLPPAPAGMCWEQSWSDEFNGSQIDSTQWAWKDGPRGPQDVGMWQADHLRVHDGALEFLTTTDSQGRMVTAGIQSRFSQLGGYFIMRAAMPDTHGNFRPALWLSSERINDYSAATGCSNPAYPTELDVLEYPARDGTAHQNIHWGGYKACHQTVGHNSAIPSDPTQYHTFGVWWDTNGHADPVHRVPRYYFYVDGNKTWESTGGGIAQVPEFIRLGNEIMAGPVAPSQAATAVSGTHPFMVDYVRAYQLRATQ